jgi:hypothetical protein
VHAVQEPVRLFVAALVSSGVAGAPDNIIAAELAVPMLCVSKRFKRSKTKNGLKTVDYIQKAVTEKLNYEWTDEVAALYDEPSYRW